MAYVKVSLIGIEMTLRELVPLTEHAEEASNRAFGTALSSLEILEGVCVKRPIQDETELARIEVEVSRPYRENLVGQLPGLATEIAEVMQPHYTKVRVILDGPGGGPQAEFCLRSNYYRDQA